MIKESPYALVSEVARYLRVEPADIKRAIKHDGLPETRFATATKTVPRIYLPDLHAWLVARTANAGPEMSSYKRFSLEFDVRVRPVALAGKGGEG